MDYLSKYYQRLTLKGQNGRESLLNKSKDVFNKQFDTSPSYSTIKINGNDSDGIVTNGNKDDEKIIGFRPDYEPELGSVIEYKNNNYLIISVFDNEISSTAHMQVCNSTLPIVGNKIKQLKLDAQGNPVLNKFGDPIYIYTEGSTTYLPCIVKSTIIASDENKQLPLPEGQLQITMQYQNIEDIQMNKIFSMYNNTYKIRTIDYTKVINDKGIIILSVEQVTSEVK